MPDELFTVNIEAGADAFGDGQHPSTQLALAALQQLSEEGAQFKNILDMGCGSGLLSIASALIWPEAQVTAVDVEENAVVTTMNNAVENGVSKRITAIRHDGYDHVLITESAPFDAVICNITADPILSLAKGLCEVLALNGIAILSGILAWRMDEVLAVHAQHGLIPLADPVQVEGGWSAVILGKEAFSTP